jgi:pyrroline-5-carboxylate reductase
MGSAAIRGLLKNEVYAENEIAACDVSSVIRERVESELGVLTTDNIEEAVDGADTVFVAIKPQDLAALGDSLRPALLSHQLILSIVAGANLIALREGLGSDRVVRAMPNTPAQIGRGVTLWTAAHGVDEDDIKRTIRILGSLGTEIFTKDESHLDMATAVSASGPAYALLVLEAWIDAAVGIGLPRDLATRLALETIQGTLALAGNSERHPADLRADVTSPGGTTAAALDQLERGALRATFASAIRAAYRRSQELGGG